MDTEPCSRPMAMVALASRCQILYECWQTRSCPLNLTIGMLIPPHALVSCLTRCRHAVKSKSRPPQLTSPGRYRVIYLNTNARALPATEASKLFETIATNLKEACRITVSTLFLARLSLAGSPARLGLFDSWHAVPFIDASLQ